MQIIKIIDAYTALTELAKQKLPLPTAYKLYKLTSSMRDKCDFYAAEEQKIVDNYTQFVKGNEIVFDEADKEKAIEFSGKIKNLREMEVEFEYEPVTVSLSEDMNVSMDDIAKLEPFVTFASE